MMMSTSKERSSLLVCGYYRLNASKSFVKGINRIMFEFYYDGFEWDQTLQEKNVHVKEDSSSVLSGNILKFTNNALTVRTIGHPDNFYCPAVNVLSAEFHSSVKWGIRFDQINENRGAMHFSFGYVKHPFHLPSKIDNDWNYWLGNDASNQCALSFSSAYYDMSTSTNEWNLIGGKDEDMMDMNKLTGWNDKGVQKGDVFSIVFDFDAMESTLYYNEKFVTKMFRNIPSVLVPAVTLVDNVQITTVEWKITYRKKVH